MNDPWAKTRTLGRAAVARFAAYWVAVLVASITGGCQPPQRTALFTPMVEAIGVVESNRSRIPAALSAKGTARGYFTDDNGQRRHFDLIAKLQLLPPDHLRFVMEHLLSGEEIEAGMNNRDWWIWVKRADPPNLSGRRGTEEFHLGGVPIQAEHLMACLGMVPLSAYGAVQRVVADFQQLIYRAQAEGDHPWIEREYWLDRYPPRLLRHVVFRDRDGRAILVSELSGYREIESGGGFLPGDIEIRWPKDEAILHLHIDRWREASYLNPGHRAFLPRDQR